MKRSSTNLKITRPRRVARSLLILCGLVAFLASSGCVTPAHPQGDETNTIVGKPPSAAEDPFFVRGTPADAERVEAQGRIEPVEPEPAPEIEPEVTVAPEPVVEETVVEEAVPEDVTPEAPVVAQTPPEVPAPAEVAPEKIVEEPSPVIAETVPEEPRIEVAARGELNAVAPPEPARTEPVIPQAPASPQCFSCVRICPVAGDCARADEDIICGWGTQKNISQAKELARAQCDATLDLARQMPVWSRIDGECPVATCR